MPAMNSLSLRRSSSIAKKSRQRSSPRSASSGICAYAFGPVMAWSFMPFVRLRNASAVGNKPSNSIRAFQFATIPFIVAVSPNNGGSGNAASRYAAIPRFSVSTVPSSSCSTGTVHRGLILRNVALNCSPPPRSTSIVSISMFFSAIKIRARRGLGAVAQS